MPETHETIADIIAEMRGIRVREFQDYADRIEAAHRLEVATTKESLAVGNSGDAAKLREACANIAEYAQSAMCHTTDAHVLGYLNQIEGWAKAALAEPVKNCEAGTAMEQGERFSAYCRAHKHPELECLPCPLFWQTGGHCELAWAQMPYEEGGAK